MNDTVRGSDWTANFNRLANSGTMSSLHTTQPAKPLDTTTPEGYRANQRSQYIKNQMANVVVADPPTRAYWQQRFEDQYDGKR